MKGHVWSGALVGTAGEAGEGGGGTHRISGLGNLLRYEVSLHHLRHGGGGVPTLGLGVRPRSAVWFQKFGFRGGHSQRTFAMYMSTAEGIMCAPRSDRMRAVRARQDAARALPLYLDLAGVAKFLGSAECRSVALLTGAGMSFGACIPDFRSPGGYPVVCTTRDELTRAVLLSA